MKKKFSLLLKKIVNKIFAFKKYIKIFERLKNIKSIKNINLLKDYKDGDSLLLIIDIEVEKNIKLLLLTIKNIKKLHSAYSNYFLNNNEFIELIQIIHNR